MTTSQLLLLTIFGESTCLLTHWLDSAKMKDRSSDIVTTKLLQEIGFLATKGPPAIRFVMWRKLTCSKQTRHHHSTSGWATYSCPAWWWRICPPWSAQCPARLWWLMLCPSYPAWWLHWRLCLAWFALCPAWWWLYPSYLPWSRWMQSVEALFNASSQSGGCSARPILRIIRPGGGCGCTILQIIFTISMSNTVL